MKRLLGLPLMRERPQHEQVRLEIQRTETVIEKGSSVTERMSWLTTIR